MSVELCLSLHHCSATIVRLVYAFYLISRQGAIASRPLHRFSLLMGGASYIVTAIKYVWWYVFLTHGVLWKRCILKTTCLWIEVLWFHVLDLLNKLHTSIYLTCCGCRYSTNHFELLQLCCHLHFLYLQRILYLVSLFTLELWNAWRQMIFIRQL